jgi:sugar phosphate isomerase/epimerase
VLGEIDPGRFSLPTVNWLRFPDDEDPAGVPRPEWPLEALLDGAAAAGFAAVGLDRHTVASYLAAGRGVGDVGKELSARGLRCTDVGVLPLGTPDVLAAAGELARLASATGAEICIAAHYAPTSFEAAARELRVGAEILSAARAKLVLEFVAYGPLRTLGEAVELCEAVGWDRCRLLVDTWHVFRGDEPLSRLPSLGGDRIGLVHVNDGAAVPEADAVYEGRFGRLLPGRGTFPLAEFAAAVEATGYRGPVGVEVLSNELRRLPPDGGARELMQALRAVSDVRFPKGPDAGR